MYDDCIMIRFTVATRTVEGESAESEPSIAVRPNEPLPAGWKEMFNVTTGKVCLGWFVTANCHSDISYQYASEHGSAETLALFMKLGELGRV